MDPEYEDMKRQLQQDARRDFPEFYACAAPAEAEMMDTLVVARRTLVAALKLPRELMSDTLRIPVERLGDATERVFTDFREQVRASAAYTAVSARERERIERGVFELPAE